LNTAAWSNDVGIGYDDIEEAKQLMLEAIDSVEDVLKIRVSGRVGDGTLPKECVSTPGGGSIRRDVRMNPGTR